MIYRSGRGNLQRLHGSAWPKRNFKHLPSHRPECQSTMYQSKNNALSPFNSPPSAFSYYLEGVHNCTYMVGKKVKRRGAGDDNPSLEVSSYSQEGWKEALPLIKLKALMILWKQTFLPNKLWNKLNRIASYQWAKQCQFCPSLSPGVVEGVHTLTV